MVKQTIVNKNKTTKAEKSAKTQKKHVSKIVVQIRRVPGSEKNLKVKKTSPKAEKSKDKEKENSEKPKRKYRKKKKQLANGEKLTFSIVDYLRTSGGDKLSVDEIKKQRREEKKAKKLNGKSEKTLKVVGNDFGNYELLGNDPDDFMIPLDVVISDDPPSPEEQLASVKVENSPTSMELGIPETCLSSNSYLGGDEVTNVSEALESNNEVYKPTNETDDSNDEVLDAECLRSAYKEILDSKTVPPTTDQKGGTHFLLSESTLSENAKSCEQCGAYFTCSYKLKRHMLSHSDERTFFCDLCEKGFKTNYHLSRHKTNVHSIVETYKCDTCDKVFASKISLKEHKDEQHPALVVYRCSICQKTFASKKGQKKHEKLHLQK